MQYAMFFFGDMGIRVSIACIRKRNQQQKMYWPLVLGSAS